MFGGGGRKHKASPASSSPGLFGMPVPAPIGAPGSPSPGLGGFASPTSSSSRPSGPTPTFGGFLGGLPTPQFGSPSPMFSAPAPPKPVFGQQSSSSPFVSVTSTTTSSCTSSSSSSSSSTPSSTSSSSLFGRSSTAPSAIFSSSVFGGQTAPPPSSKTEGLFSQGAAATTASSKSEGLFGQSSPGSGSGLFGGVPTNLSSSSTPIFGQQSSASSSSGSLFSRPDTKGPPGSRPNSPVSGNTGASSLFGSSVFGSSSSMFSAPVSTSNSLFGKSQPAKGGATAKFLQEMSSSEHKGLADLVGKEEERERVEVEDEEPLEEVDEGELDDDNNEGFPPPSDVFQEATKAQTISNIFTDNSKETKSLFNRGFGETGDVKAVFAIQNVVGEEDKMSRTSVKSRLGPPAMNSEISTVDESVFSKPKIVRETLASLETGERKGAAGGGEEEEQEQPPSETESEMSEGGTRRGRISRTVSREELSSITSIICEAVPDVINKSPMLTRHFSKFGEVVRVVCNNKRKSSVVTFSEHKAARRAKEKGKTVHASLPPVKISYSQQLSPRSRKGSVEANQEQKPSVRLMTARKTLSVKPERKTDSREMTVVTNSVTGEGEQTQAQLLAVMRQVTHSDQDKWSVLEARDKYIRLRQPRSVTRSGLDIQDMNLVGTCPDFCPEKERYERSTKNRLEWYEKGEGGRLNHLAAVKEHSRSAADQGIPLPHELRPASVLSRTLDFLMCNVVDRIDYMEGSMDDWFQFIDKLHLENLVPSYPMTKFYVTQKEAGESVADWFVFMWSVTRAIRKDVSQQNLADLVSVSILEKCARFHILCAERLCEESFHDFSPKLNDENLTKCLQTLKYMYYDLSLEEVICPREHEFRAYEVLMNLNQGDTLREVQTLGEHLRYNERVQFSLKCFAALNTNNYVSFFKLVRKATYLEACILKRYFYQVRRKAVETIQRAFTPGKGMIQFPIERIQRLLGFESILDCSRFLRAHGVESEDGAVFLERGTFMLPETEPAMSRAPNLIDSKRAVSYGEVMNGGPLPENPYFSYKPHNSFDEEGVLRPEAYEAKDQEVMISPEEVEKIKKEEEKKAVETAVVKVVVEEMVEEAIETEAQNMIEEAVYDAETENVTVEMCQNIEEEVVAAMVDNVSAETLRTARNQLLAAKIEEEQRMEVEESAYKQLVDEMVSDLIIEVANEEMKNVETRRKLDRILSVSKISCENIFEEIIKDEVVNIATTVLAEAEEDKTTRLEQLRQKVSLHTVRKCFSAWRTLSSRSSRQKAAVLNFPAGPAPLTEVEQNSKLGWERQHRPQNLASVVEAREALDWMFGALEIQDSIVQSSVLQPFPLLDWFQASLKDERSLRVDWKLILSCPTLGTNEEDGEASQLLQMIRMKFRRSVEERETVCLDDLLVCCGKECGNMQLRMCVRELSPSSLEEATFSETVRRQLLSGTSGIMFIYLENMEELQEAKDRLASVLINKPKDPSVPLLLLSSISKEETVNVFNLDQYLADGIISHYQVVTITTDIFDIDQTVSVNLGVHNLVDRRPPGPETGLVRKPLRELAEDFLSQHVFAHWFAALKERNGLDLPDRGPDELLHLYNSAVEHLQSVVRDPLLVEVSWPAAELVTLGGPDYPHTDTVPGDWNLPIYTESLADTLGQLELPIPEVYETGSWRGLVEQLQHYLVRVTVPEQDCSVAASSLSKELCRAYRDHISRCGGQELVPPPSILPWTHLSHLVVRHRLAGVLGGHPGELLVLVREEMLHQWETPREWRAGLGWGAQHMERTVTELVEETIAEEREHSELTIEEQEQGSEHAELRKAIRREQKQCMRFENMLEQAVKEQETGARPYNYQAGGHREEAETEQNNVEDVFDLDEMTTKTEFVPVISYISPSLGRLVSPLKVLTRQEMVTTGRSPRHSSTPKIASKRKAEQTVKPQHGKKSNSGSRLLPRMELDQRLDTLKVGISQDMEHSRQFEARLQAALGL